ncbi:MAG: hypothetical protein UV78_C0065G0003 [Parcubacteria group bacterium GW2011_GWA2_43_17]|nr:MAG: hypothetical protein UV78_C0065G0003 [Parcubacteria group bacterium GW2011_GWA2_43_17]
MTDDVQYVENWPDEKTQCQNCRQYQQQNSRHACVPNDMTFEQAIAEYGKVKPNAHCNHFTAR